jgi:protein SCO1
VKKNKKSKMSVSSKVAAFSMFTLVVIGLIYFISVAFGGINRLPVLGEPGHTAGAFSFINQDGKRITERSVQSKVTVVEYFFTSCPSLCPVMNKNLKQVYDRFKADSDFMILSHTVDPERDSVSVMSRYAKRFGAEIPGWQFLTGDKNALYNAASKDYLLSAMDSGGANFIHTQYVALLDRKRQVRGFYDFTNGENVLKLESDIKLLLKD